tara:strand:- start:43 stop:660 length:618 start_codon:yes stop_codon:yes gene_type:complete
MTDMLCFSINYLEDLPKELQLSIMGEVSELDKKERAIMDTIHMVYEKSCDRDLIYFDIDYLIKRNNKDEGVLRSLNNTIDEDVYRDNWIDLDAEHSKNYIINKVGVFKALRNFSEMSNDDIIMKMIHCTSDDCTAKYHILYQHLVARELKNLFTEEQWNMMYKFKLYEKYIESIDLEGIDTPTGFDYFIAGINDEGHRQMENYVL